MYDGTASWPFTSVHSIVIASETKLGKDKIY